jgi:hypothetical protein
MSAKNSKLFFVSTVAAGIGLAVWYKRRADEVPNLNAWSAQMDVDFSLPKAAELRAEIRRRHAGLLMDCPIPTNKKLRTHLLGNILPGLALYQTLLADTAGDQSAALAEVDRLFRAATLPKSRLITAPFKLLADPFPLFRLAFHRMIQAYPTEGWDYTWLEDRSERIAFNYSRCFYLDTLTSLGAPELTPSFCKTDEVMAECFPAQVRFVREHTLGRGDALCDFQYIRVP